MYSLHKNTLHVLSEMIAAAGLRHPSEVGPHHLVRRVSRTEVRLFSQLHTFLKSGDLLGEHHSDDFYGRMWRWARADSFELAQAT